MLRRLVMFGGVAVVLALAIVGFLVFRTPDAASGPIEAIPLATSAAVVEAAPTSAPMAVVDAPTTAPVAAETTAPTTAPATDAAPTTGQIFEIVSDQSEARFLIDEVLRGEPVTVVGATSQVAGQIAINPTAPASSQIGIIQVNARDLTTDNDFRNRAIKNAILRTNDHEFITFTPTGVSGMPASVTVGEAFTFQISGDLTITDVTRPVTFDVTVTPVSTTQIEGVATTSVLYSDFALAIPDSPAVDTVADEVRIELSFIAQAAA